MTNGTVHGSDTQTDRWTDRNNCHSKYTALCNSVALQKQQAAGAAKGGQTVPMADKYSFRPDSVTTSSEIRPTRPETRVSLLQLSSCWIRA